MYNLEEIKETVTEIFDKYDVVWENYGVDKILSTWKESKGPLIELLRKHPNWNEDKLYVTFDQDVEGQPNENVIYEFIDSVYSMSCTSAMRALRKYRNQFLDEVMVGVLKESYPDLRFSEGQKTSRAVRRICSALGLDKRIYEFEREYAKYSDAINPLNQTRHTVLSVNPVDYLLSSNGNSWSSCHTLDKNNSNGYSGCNCSGTLSYMMDGTTMVYYHVDREYDGNNLELEPKIIRQLFHYDKGILVQGRLYPQCNDGKNSLYVPIRAQVQKIFADCTGEPNLWRKRGGTEECRKYTESYGTHYRDYTCQSECNVSRLVSMIPEGEDNRRIVIGHTIYCTVCGDVHENTSYLNCGCREEVYYCEECGCSIDPDDVVWIEGEPYCRDCVSYCEDCGEYYLSDEVGWYDSLGRYVCDRCISEYEKCSVCGEYIDDGEAVTDAHDNPYCESCADDYLVEVDCTFYHRREVARCNVCGELYVKVDGLTGICPDCLEEVKAEEEANEIHEEK